VYREIVLRARAGNEATIAERKEEIGVQGLLDSIKDEKLPNSFFMR